MQVVWANGDNSGVGQLIEASLWNTTNHLNPPDGAGTKIVVAKGW